GASPAQRPEQPASSPTVPAIRVRNALMAGCSSGRECASAWQLHSPLLLSIHHGNHLRPSGGEAGHCRIFRTIPPWRPSNCRTSSLRMAFPTTEQGSMKRRMTIPSPKRVPSRKSTDELRLRNRLADLEPNLTEEERAPASASPVE